MSQNSTIVRARRLPEWDRGDFQTSMTGVPTSGDEREENIMPLINVVVVLIVVGVLLWLVNTYIPMDRKIKSILNAVVVIGVVIWLLQAFGLMGDLRAIRIGK